MQSWSYEGMVALTRSERPDKRVEGLIRESLAELEGLDLNEDFCRPRIENCTNADLRRELW